MIKERRSNVNEEEPLQYMLPDKDSTVITAEEAVARGLIIACSYPGDVIYVTRQLAAAYPPQEIREIARMLDAQPFTECGDEATSPFLYEWGCRNGTWKGREVQRARNSVCEHRTSRTFTLMFRDEILPYP